VVDDVVGVLHALGDSFEGQQIAQSVAGDEGRKLVVADFGVDGHGSRGLSRWDVSWRWRAARAVR
jgi:hypothetical protein